MTLGQLLEFDLLLLSLADQEVLILAADLPQSLLFALLLARDMVRASRRASIASIPLHRIRL